MSIPHYINLGKNARDIFTKGYDSGAFKLNVKSKTSTGVEISSEVVNNLETTSAYGILETRYKFEECGLKFLQTLDTNNIINTEVTFLNSIVKGTELSVNCSYAPVIENISGNLKGTYSDAICALSANLDMNLALKASAVLGYNGWLGGIQTTCDFSNMKIIGNNFALGYMAEDFIVHSALNNGTEIIGSIYQKVNPNLEIGIQIASSLETNETQLEMGCKYKLDTEASVCAKIHTNGQMGFGYQQRLHEGIIFCLTSLYSISDICRAGHKLGLALEFVL